MPTGRNPEHANLLISSLLTIANSPALPIRDGHEAVVQESTEAAVDETDDFDRGTCDDSAIGALGV
jgi:hypothetical protein